MLNRTPIPRLLMILALALTAAGSGDPAAHAASERRTDIVRLDTLSVERAMALWDRLIGPRKGSRIVPGGVAQTIVVHDTPDRLARFRGVLALIDGGSDEERLFVRPVVHLDPSELVALLNEIFSARKDKVPLVMVPDDRSMQLVVRATTPRYMGLDRLIRRLDVSAKRRQRVIEVLPAPPGEIYK